MKTDLSKTDKSYYHASREPQLIVFKPAVYLSIEGKGDPSAPDFSSRIKALYTVAYALKFLRKESGGDFVVPKLEGLWWYDETKYTTASLEEAPALIPRSEWEYRLLIRMPEQADEKLLEPAKKKALAKDKSGETPIAQVKWFELSEGKCVQILHEGPFDQEVHSLSRIKAFAEQNGLSKNGLHHEIYLSDFRKTPPGKLKTILREPVR